MTYVILFLASIGVGKQVLANADLPKRSQTGAH
jgi:hypothetical protein